MGRLKIWILMAGILIHNTATAVEVDKAAHFGIAYAGQVGLYGLYREVFGLSDNAALILAAGTMLTIGVLKEIGDQAVGAPSGFDSKDILANTLG